MSKDVCPKCDHELVYDHYLDSMKCLFCNYRYNISEPSDIDENDNKMCYSNDDDVSYGDFVEGL
jgi:uncharacterized CHY-type Zn-finger protein